MMSIDSSFDDRRLRLAHLWRSLSFMPRFGCWFLWMVMAVPVLVLGCSTPLPDWMVPPPVDPRGIAQAIMAQADADENGSLEGKELATIPALQASLTPLDTNADRKLSRDEIETWLEQVKKDGVPQRDVSFKIMARGKPLANAAVKLVPEACMGGTIEAAEGKTDESGVVFLNIPTLRTLGVRCGLYRLEVTGTRANGRPIPAKYGKDSPLGYAVGGGLPEDWTPEIVVD
jgi:hypothetical protein